MQIVTTPKKIKLWPKLKTKLWPNKKNQFVTKLKNQIVTVVIVTVLTVAVVTVVLGTYFSKNNLTPLDTNDMFSMQIFVILAMFFLNFLYMHGLQFATLPLPDLDVAYPDRLTCMLLPHLGAKSLICLSPC